MRVLNVSPTRAARAGFGRCGRTPRAEGGKGVRRDGAGAGSTRPPTSGGGPGGFRTGCRGFSEAESYATAGLKDYGFRERGFLYPG